MGNIDLITSVNIKEKFLKFFEDNQHLKISNSSIIPKNDPTLLFINSGMAPLKRFFTGEEIPASKRLCNIQPCIRTIDIDEVGDKHHLTSFQMLGSWSIGDYFKKEAINLAFRFLTEYLKIPKEKLYVSIFGGDPEIGLEEDDEARQYWLDVGVNADHIVSCPKEDNFWGPTSETGPCGPCTEIFYDTGDENGILYKPGGYFDTKKRYIEIWNAGVFMQFNKNKDGSFSKLKFKSVDTGAGLERLAMILNQKESVYDTDLLLPIKNKIIENLDTDTNISNREILIMTDHLRTACLILSEKVQPSNEGRGYIPRKLIRKCILITTKSGNINFKFDSVLNFILDNYKDIFPNFETNKNYIIKEFQKEYEQFIKVITTGLEKLKAIKDSKNNIDANEAFELVTTFGLPIDIIKDFSQENNLLLDESGFLKKLSEHKNISKNSKNNKNKIFTSDFKFLDHLQETIFEGYETLKTKSKILNIINSENKLVETALAQDEVGLILDKTVFYAESGGQCSDIGYIYNNNFKIKIDNVQKTSNGVYLHFGKIIFGNLDSENQDLCVNLEVDDETRQALSNNHTCVHLLHSALRSIYGNELHQAGSKVEKEKLRFDFNCEQKIDIEDISKIESLVNSYIQKNIEIRTQNKSLEDAIKDGAIALFENKYSDKVREVSVANISRELCGGTHTSRTGNIGLFIILSVEGIGKGIKRITALTGQEALKYIQEQIILIKNISKTLGVNPEKISEKILDLNNLRKSNNYNKKSNIKSSELSYETKISKSGVEIAFIFEDEFNKSARDSVIEIADKINGVAIYFCQNQNQVLVASSQNIEDEYKAKNILSKILTNFSGRGGGSDRVASGGSVIINNNQELLSIF